MEQFLIALRQSTFVIDTIFKSVKLSDAVAAKIAKEFSLIADCIENNSYEMFLEERVDVVKRCAGITTKNAPCSKKASVDSEFCKIHMNKEKKVLCAGETKKGTQCKRAPLEGSEFCKAHAEPEEEKVLCAGETKKGTQCKRAPLEGSEFCKAHAEPEEEREYQDDSEHGSENDKADTLSVTENDQDNDDQDDKQDNDDQDDKQDNDENMLEEVSDEPFEAYEFENVKEELSNGTCLDNLPVFKSTANYICLVLNEKPEVKYEYPVILRTRKGYQLVAETTKKGNSLFSLRLSDSYEFEMSHVKDAFLFLRRTFNLEANLQKLVKTKARKISEH
jgi:hypothetical protein